MTPVLTETVRTQRHVRARHVTVVRRCDRQIPVKGYYPPPKNTHIHTHTHTYILESQLNFN